MLFQLITVARDTRVAHLIDGRFVHLYGPGRHFVWTWPSQLHEFLRYLVTEPPKQLEVADPLPVVEEWELVEVGVRQRALVTVPGERGRLLETGRFRLWKARGPAEVRVFDVDAEPVPLAEGDRLPPATAGPWTEAVADDAGSLVLQRDGVPLLQLGAGRYRVWRDGPWALLRVPRALMALDIAVQDLVTADQVPVRVKPTAHARVSDPLTFVREPEAIKHAYTAVQLALREVVGELDLEALLTSRSKSNDAMLARASALLGELGLKLDSVGIKDVILPGEVKELVNRVTLARKEAEALSIKRREEVAATRQLANTAKLLEANPVLLRLRELEAMAEIAERVDNLVLVGGEGLLKSVSLRDVLPSA